MKDLDADGVFWLEDAPDEQVAGRLTFTARDGGRLSLIGSFSEIEQFGEFVGPRRIHGVAGERLLTLDDCYQVTKRIGMPGIVREEYQVSWILSGDHFRGDQASRFTAVHVRLRHLEHWVNRTGTSIETKPGRNQYQLGRVTVSHDPLERLTIPTEDGALEVAFPVSMNLGSFEARISQGCSFTVRFEEPVGLQRAFARCTALQDLVTISLDAPAAVTQISLSHPESVRKRSDGEDVHNSIEALTKLQGSHSLDGDDEKYPANMLLTFDDIGGLQGVAGWLKTAERFGAVVGVLLAYWYVPDMNADTRFLNAVIAAEALERVRTGKQEFPFKNALVRIAEDADELAHALVGDVESWAHEVREMRVLNVVHRGLNEEIDHARMFYLAEALYMLVVVSLLRECGVSGSTVSGIQHHQRFQWTAEGLRTTA